MLNYFLLTGIWLALVSCADSKAYWNDFTKSIQTAYWNTVKGMRKPGDELISKPQTVWQQYQCDKLMLPFILVETNELLPPQLPAGQELNHHMIYVMCPSKEASIVRGKLTRAIYYQGHPVLTDDMENFEFKPGRWSVDAFIKVAPQAPPGNYSLTTTFNAGGIEIEESESFIVE